MMGRRYRVTDTRRSRRTRDHPRCAINWRPRGCTESAGEPNVQCCLTVSVGPPKRLSEDGVEQAVWQARRRDAPFGRIGRLADRCFRDFEDLGQPSARNALAFVTHAGAYPADDGAHLACVPRNGRCAPRSLATNPAHRGKIPLHAITMRVRTRFSNPRTATPRAQANPTGDRPREGPVGVGVGGTRGERGLTIRARHGDRSRTGDGRMVTVQAGLGHGLSTGRQTMRATIPAVIGMVALGGTLSPARDRAGGI